jgi:MFS family permease
MAAVDRKIFATLFFALFATVTGVGIVVPLLPLYARHLGAGGFGIGLIFGAFSFSRSLFLPYFGYRSDSHGRKPFIVWGLLSYTLAAPVFALCTSVPALIAVRFVQGIASAMIMPVVQAYVGDITPEGSEGLSMGAFNMSTFWGLSLGPMLGGLIQDRFGLHAAFGAMGALSLIGFALCLLFLPAVAEEPVIRRRAPASAWRGLLNDGPLAGLFAFRLAYTSCIGVIWGFLPVLADSRLGLSATSIGILVMLGVFTSGLLQTPMGWVADRISRTALVLTGGTISSLAVGLFGWADSFSELFWANIAFGVGGGIAMPSVMAMAMAAGTRTQGMGAVMGLITMAHSLGMMLGAMVAGTMMEVYELKSAFFLAMVLMVMGVGAFGMSCRKRGYADGKN